MASGAVPTLVDTAEAEEARVLLLLRVSPPSGATTEAAAVGLDALGTAGVLGAAAAVDGGDRGALGRKKLRLWIGTTTLSSSATLQRKPT